MAASSSLKAVLRAPRDVARVVVAVSVASRALQRGDAELRPVARVVSAQELADDLHLVIVLRGMRLHEAYGVITASARSSHAPDRTLLRWVNRDTSAFRLARCPSASRRSSVSCCAVHGAAVWAAPRRPVPPLRRSWRTPEARRRSSERVYGLTVLETEVSRTVRSSALSSF